MRPLIKLKFQNEMCIILYSTENQFDMFILSNLFCLIGVPEQMMTDQGTQSRSKLMAETSRRQL